MDEVRGIDRDTGRTAVLAGGSVVISKGEQTAEEGLAVVGCWIGVPGG